jgi:tRNA G18 (ribose-2'-O)-methylase SpoU
LRGYFGIGIEGASKPMNVGALFRTAHAFGASFVFTVDAHPRVRSNKSDTSKALGHLPYYDWASAGDMVLPEDCKVVAIELLDEAVDLPSFTHPQKACYVLGRERGAVSRDLIERADHVIRIPTKFCINVGLAGAIVMYDRQISLGRFAPRPVMTGQTPEALPEPFFGDHTPRGAKD